MDPSRAMRTSPSQATLLDCRLGYESLPQQRFAGLLVQLHSVHEHIPQVLGWAQAMPKFSGDLVNIEDSAEKTN
ncbi:hypothetical protein RJ639_001651 [Escallonia herrerae]|uniref:Uncharacterized protein n=1 Tax=Escallonia herrerae TaxID=1293975 RepID=A0AA89BH35_9ASTE|nr:hypothetical protein RJ639_001651 [Escallonia herrerae]